jgi:hypothetical protein
MSQGAEGHGFGELVLHISEGLNQHQLVRK